MKYATVPDFGSEGFYQQVPVAEPGDPGYPTPRLPDSDPWAHHVNALIDQVERHAGTGHQAYPVSHQAGEPEPEAGS